MSTRAYQLSTPELKQLCGILFLNINSQSKETIIEKLLDFLGCPQKRPGRPPLKRRAVSSDYEDLPGIRGSGTKSDDDEDSSFPDDHQLRQWTRAYVRCFNTNKVTVQNALDTAADKFGVDLSSKHTRIKELLVEEL